MVLGTFDDQLEREALGVLNYGLHTHDVQQELLTLKQRHLVETPDPHLAHYCWAVANKELNGLRNQVPKLARVGLKTLIGNKTGRAKNRFKAGWHEYFTDGIQWYHGRVTCMQKLEFHAPEKLPKKADRAIQYRSVAFNAAIARYLNPIEHYLFNETEYKGMRWCAKGLTKEERALQIMDMADQFRSPLFVLADHSTFDAHVNPQLLKLEHKFYKQVWNYDDELCRLLHLQKINRGRTKGGIKYEVKGTRMSGDINTALGNSLINFAMLAAWVRNVDARILLDGDDSVIVMERDDFELLPKIEDFMRNFGMKTIAEVVTDISDVEFCQSKPVLGVAGPYLCPTPRKILDTILKSPRRMSGPEALSVLKGSIYCELVANPGMPMMRPLAEWLRREGGVIKIPPWLEYRMTQGYGLELGNEIAWQEPTLDQRISFWKAWDVTPECQREYENLKFRPLVTGVAKAKQGKEVPYDPIIEFDAIEWEEQQEFLPGGKTPVRWSDRETDWQQVWTQRLAC